MATVEQSIPSQPDDFDRFKAELDNDLLPSHPQYLQSAFGVVAPPPELVFVNDIKGAAVYFYSTKVEGKKDESPFAPLRLSDIRPLMYFKSWVEGKIQTPYPKQYEIDESQKAVTQGIVFHQLDALFRSVMMGNIGIGVLSTFPTHKKSDLLSYIDATRLSRVGSWLNKEELSQEFQLVASALLHGTTEKEGLHIKGSLPFFPKIPNPSKIDAVLHSPETNAEIRILCDAWADAVSSPDGVHLEFMRKTKTYREVFIIINLSNGLQVKVQFDSMSRFIEPHGKVAMQIADLKTGRKGVGTPLDEEIKKREAQVMLMAAERLTSYMATTAYGKHSIRDYINNGSIVFAADHANRAHIGRAEFYYRRLDREKRRFEFEHVEMADEATRKDFETWFSELGEFYHRRRTEVKKFLKKARVRNI
jgi:hypothetical protein